MSKRANGEGTVRQRPNGTWEARLAYTDPITDTRKRMSFYGPTAAAVRAKLKDAQARLAAEEPVRDSGRQLGDYINHWSDTALEASPRKESTKATYRLLAVKHLTPAPLGTTPLAKLRKTHIDALIVKLREQGLSDSTVRQVYTILRGILADAKLDGLIADNPAVKVPRPRIARKEAKYLSAGQVAAVLKAAEGMRYFPALMLIAATGLRRGEGLALHWKDVDLDAGTIKVTATLGRVRKQLLITEPKTARSRRTIPIPPSVVKLLKAQRASQAADRLHAGNQWTDTGLVFTTEFGGPVDPRNLLRTMQTAAKKAGVEGVGVHTLRHSAATAMSEAGVPLKAASDLLGHSSIAITADIYGHTSDASARSAIDSLTKALGL